MASKDLKRAYDTLAGKYRVPLAVIESLAKMIEHGRGGVIRFDIPDLGGEGIWRPGEIAQIGNGFNNELNNRATELCTEIAELLQEERMDETTIVGQLDETTGFMPASIAPSSKTWWPARYGNDATMMGNVGGLRFVYFEAHDRLVIQNNLRNRIFDTSSYDVIDVVAGERPGFFNTVIKTKDDNISITQLREVAR